MQRLRFSAKPRASGPWVQDFGEELRTSAVVARQGLSQ